MRVIYIARELNAITQQKFDLMVQDPELELWLVRPCPSISSTVVRAASGYTVLDTPVLYRLQDPHRTLYRTWDLGLRRARPAIIHAEAEPDSLSALQVLAARHRFAPSAKVILHTWQNVDRQLRPYVRLVRSIALHNTDAILCCNRGAHSLLRNRFGYLGASAVINSHGVNIDVFYPPQLPLPPLTSSTVTYIGRLVPEKGLDTLVQAVAHLPTPTRLQLVGDGPIRTDLYKLAAELGITERVVFSGAVPYARVREVLIQSSVVVLPSRRTAVWQEQFGRVLVEAMACGVPVIGSDTGAIPEVIGEGGIIFPEGDIPALADALHRLLTSPDLCQRVGNNGYQRVLRYFTHERVAAQTTDFYHRLLGNTRPANEENIYASGQ